MVNERTIFEKYRSERSNELALACCITRHTVSAVLYDIALKRRYARCVQFGVTVSADNAITCIGNAALRLMRESGTAGNVVRKLGFAAPADVTMIIEEMLSPTDLFLSPETEFVILPIISASLGGDFTAVIAAALQHGGNVLEVDMTGGFRAASCVDGQLKTACLPMKGGLDYSGIESGMPLEFGAIDQLSREPDGTLCYSVIGDGDGLGVSASAAAQAVRIMLDIGALDSDGIMTDRDLFYIGEDHFISQNDVRAVQSDKAACRAALERLGELTGTHDRVIISGEAFGNEQGAAAMAQLGAVPRGLGEKYGWSRSPAEQGLINCLTDPELLGKLTELCGSAEDISPLMNDGFDELYIKNLVF
ncbi:MAG: ASKHA domain-containing protein [Oscillospiraceae bacterium]|nr:ASKHA domain-containing protein [Oscillospiraceae bacterium]